MSSSYYKVFVNPGDFTASGHSIVYPTAGGVSFKKLIEIFNRDCIKEGDYTVYTKVKHDGEYIDPETRVGDFARSRGFGLTNDLIMVSLEA